MKHFKKRRTYTELRLSLQFLLFFFHLVLYIVWIRLSIEWIEYRTNAHTLKKLREHRRQWRKQIWTRNQIGTQWNLQIANANILSLFLQIWMCSIYACLFSSFLRFKLPSCRFFRTIFYIHNRMKNVTLQLWS